MKLPWTPMKAGVVAFLLTCLVGAIVGFIVMEINGVAGDDSFARGQALGTALAPIALVVGAIAYFRQKKKYDASDRV